MKNFLKHLLIALTLLLMASPVFANKDIYVIHFVLDGLRYDVMEKAIQSGEVPHLKTLFYDPGAVFEKALTTFPTVSSPGYISFATGLSAGNSGIFFLEWFDRTKQKPVGYLTPKGFDQVNSDLLNRVALANPKETELYSPLTLFERLAPAPTASIYTPFRKGATLQIPQKLPLKGLWNGLVTKNGLALDKLAMQELQNLFTKPLPQVPRYSLVALYGTDFYGHKEGPASEEVGWDLKQFDAFFHQFYQLLQERGLLDKTYLILSSDHGMHETGKLLNLRKVLWEQGLGSSDSIYVSNRGVSSTFLYAAGDEGWGDLPSIFRLRNFPTRKKGPVDLIKVLYGHPSIGWVAARDSLDRVHLYSKGGESIITHVSIGGKNYYSYTYRLEDPLGYAKNPSLEPMLQDKPYPAEKWLEATVDEYHPNAVVELSHLFKDPRAGDILIMAEEAWGFRSVKAGTHGSLHQGDMHIPLWIVGPTIPQGKYKTARSVDVYPLILNLFGLEAGPNQEGVSPLEAKSTGTKESESLVHYLAQMESTLMRRPPLLKMIDRGQLIREMKQTYPQEREEDLLAKCNQEIEERYQRWKKLNHFTTTLEKGENPLGVSNKQKKNMNWLLVNERNLEFERLRRMEDIKMILESPLR